MAATARRGGKPGTRPDVAKRNAATKSKFKPEFCERLVEWGKCGLSFEAFASELGVAIRTLRNWQEDHPEFAEARERFDAHSLLWWERRGIEGMAQGNKCNATIWIFNMKNRFGWRDRTPEEASENTDAIAAKVAMLVNALSD